ncbi:protein CIP2A homolog [Hyalella azteca]|uniref:Protein CIP2A homolog n=1 Tax=Hyalella azteca TaxID=294128 RepID=A0A8B7NZZ2_HYAAZ|nr:protein CIP2A homolog [Hyalella azteca]
MASSDCSGSNLQQIKKFIRMTYDYFLRPEKVMPQLQRQMQLLTVEEDLTTFEPSSIETLEFYSCLDMLLAKPDSQNVVAWKAILLISHMAKSPVVLRALRDEVQMVPVLGEYLQIVDLSADRYLKTLTLLQKITHGIKIERKEAWLPTLLPHLVHTIIESVETTGDRDKLLLCPALTTLCNLCRCNLPVLQCLVQWANPNRLLTVLVSKLHDCSKSAQLLSMELWLLITTVHPIDSEESVILQVDRALSLLLAVCREGFSHGSAELIQLATDVLVSFSHMPQVRSKLVSNKTCGRDIMEIWKLVDKCEEQTLLPHVSDFLSALIKLDLPQAADILPAALDKAVTWVESSGSHWGLRLLHAFLCTASQPLTEHQITSFCVAAGSVLQKSLGGAGVEQVLVVVAAVQLLQEVLKRVPAMHSRVTLSPPELTACLEKLSEIASQSSELQKQGALVAQKLSSKSTRPLDSMMANSSSGGDCSQCSDGHDAGVSSSFLFSCGSSVSFLCAEAIVRILHLVKQIGKEDLQFSLHFCELMKCSYLMPHVMICHASLNRDLVALAVELLCDSSASQESLDVIINMTCEQNRRCQNSEILASPAVGRGSVLEDAFDSMHISNDSGFQRAATDRGSISEIFKRVDDLMARLNAIVAPEEMRDLPLTDLVEMYEFKLGGMAHTEAALQELLSVADSKSRVLERSLLRTKVENHRVLGLVRAREERVQSLLAEKLADQEQARTIRETLSKEKAAVERESCRLRGSLNSLHAELATKDKKLQLLSSALEEATAETASLQKMFEKEKSKKEGLQQELESLQSTHSTIEKIVAKQKQENLDLEKMMRNLEQTVADRDTKIEELTKTNLSLQKIRDVIHNISSGKPLA